MKETPFSSNINTVKNQMHYATLNAVAWPLWFLHSTRSCHGVFFKFCFQFLFLPILDATSTRRTKKKDEARCECDVIQQRRQQQSLWHTEISLQLLFLFWRESDKDDEEDEVEHGDDVVLQSSSTTIMRKVTVPWHTEANQMHYATWTNVWRGLFVCQQSQKVASVLWKRFRFSYLCLSILDAT